METKIIQKKKKYSLEFKQEAVALASRQGTTAAAQDLGIQPSMIRSWRRKLQDSEQPHSSQKKSYAELEKEIKRLSKENGYLKEINQVLKKSTVIFATSDKKDWR